MNFKPPETDDEARTVNIIERQRSTQQARLALLEQASQVASKHLFIERARSCSSLLPTENVVGIASSEQSQHAINKCFIQLVGKDE